MIFNRVTTGAQDDLAKAWKIAHRMVVEFGMSEKVGYVAHKENQYQRLQSDETENIIDAEINLIIREALDKAKNLVQQKRDLVMMYLIHIKQTF